MLSRLQAQQEREEENKKMQREAKKQAASKSTSISQVNKFDQCKNIEY